MTKEKKTQIKVQSIKFGSPPFRKLREIQIDFAERITLIAGHNSIGKSTILGLLSNTFGITSTSYRSYFQEPYFTNIERIVYIALNEVDAGQVTPNSAPIVTAQVGGSIIQKRCSLTRRTKAQRARMVPRTINPLANDPIGPDAKIPLPTIYLGTRRLASVGEADEKEVSSSPVIGMDDSDRHLMATFVNNVIIGSKATTEITHHTIRGIRKRSAHPGHETHDTLAISMGQDSLGSIATALASFNRLKREMAADYPGGLLIIDELDIGFHPHAIDRLMGALKTYARKLSLQIIATTHSPRMIAALHPEGGGHLEAPDSVKYLVDTQRPRLAEDQSLSAILRDMALESDDQPVERPTNLCVYFEDNEAMQFCEAFIPSAKRGALTRKTGHSVRFIALGVGGSILTALPEKDPIFKDRVLVVDADTTINRKAAQRGNTIKLPCAANARGTARSPENTIKHFLKEMKNATEGPLYESMLKLKTSNPSSDKIRSTFFMDGDGDKDDRESSEAWWRKHWPTLQKWGVLALWRDTYPTQSKAFIERFEEAIFSTAARLKK